MSNPTSSDMCREEQLLAKLGELTGAHHQLVQELHQLSFTLVDLIVAHKKMLCEGACLITEKSIHLALEDLEKRKKPLDHRRVPRRKLQRGNSKSKP